MDRRERPEAGRPGAAGRPDVERRDHGVSVPRVWRGRVMSRFFIRRPIVAIVIAIMTVLGGLLALSGLAISQFPQIVPPQILITATYPGADALTIEQSVATPLEQQMNGVDDMLYMQSSNANDGTMTLTVPSTWTRSPISTRSTSRTASRRRSRTCRPRSINSV